MSLDDMRSREERLLSMFGGDKKLAVELAKLFLLHYPEMHSSLKEGVKSLDPAAVRKSVHMIEGSLGAMASVESSEILASLGQAARDMKLEKLPDIFANYNKAIELSNQDLTDIIARWL